jgi:hypothetical protein
MLCEETMVSKTLRLLGTSLAVVLAATVTGCHDGPPPVAADAPAGNDRGAAQDKQAQPQDQGGEDASLEDFNEPLSNYGNWVEVEGYGRVWQPSEDVAGEDFVPYASDGSWAANDDGTYVFESKYDQEFGWATYHYGRWVEHDEYGWVWIPGTTWAPSWVEWRYGGGYVGWVPMGPPGYTVVESRWVFVETRYFGAPAVYSYRLGPDRAPMAYVAARPLVEVRGSARWTVGPPIASVRAEGGVMRTAHYAPPGRAGAKAAAKASKARGAGKARASSAPVKRGKAAKAAHHEAKEAHHEAKEAKHEAKEAKHEAKEAKHEAKEAKHEAKEAKHEAKEAKHEAREAKHDAPKPAPKPAPKASPPSKKRK